MTVDASNTSVLGVNRSAALDLLPEVYAWALRLREDGHSNAEIARALGIPPEAGTSTLELAEAKLERLMHRDGGPPQSRARDDSTQ